MTRAWSAGHVPGICCMSSARQRRLLTRAGDETSDQGICFVCHTHPRLLCCRCFSSLACFEVCGGLFSVRQPFLCQRCVREMTTKHRKTHRTLISVLSSLAALSVGRTNSIKSDGFESNKNLQHKAPHQREEN